MIAALGLLSSTLATPQPRVSERHGDDVVGHEDISAPMPTMDMSMDMPMDLPMDMSMGMAMDMPMDNAMAAPSTLSPGAVTAQSTHPHPAHSHSHSGPVLTVWNETYHIERYGKDPLSFLEYDWVLSTEEVVKASLEYSATKRASITRRHGGHHDDEDSEMDDEVHTSHGKAHAQSSSSSIDHLPHPHLLLVHAFSLAISFFVLIPISLAIKAARIKFMDPARTRITGLGWTKIVASAGFWICTTVGWVAGVLYKSRTPDL